MLLELITTVCNIGTLGVLVAGAAAAFVQLRHVRAGTELAAILAIERAFNDPDLQRALIYTQDELPARLTDAGYRGTLAARGFVDAREHPEMIVCNWLNDTGSLVTGGFIGERVFFHAYARIVVYYWTLLGPVVALLRRERGSDQYANVERLAVRAQSWLERHRDGTYPANVPRLPLPEPRRDGRADREPA